MRGNKIKWFPPDSTHLIIILDVTLIKLQNVNCLPSNVFRYFGR